jgi:hypothetical protein
MVFPGIEMTRRVPRFVTRPVSSASGPVGAAAATNARRSLNTATADFRVGDQGARTKLISDISCLLREPALPESARSAGLELIGFLARRMPGEAPHALGVPEAQEAARSGRRLGHFARPFAPRRCSCSAPWSRR